MSRQVKLFEVVGNGKRVFRQKPITTIRSTLLQPWQRVLPAKGAEIVLSVYTLSNPSKDQAISPFVKERYYGRELRNLRASLDALSSRR